MTTEARRRPAASSAAAAPALPRPACLAVAAGKTAHKDVHNGDSSYDDDNDDGKDRRMLMTSPASDRAAHCEEVGERGNNSHSGIATAVFISYYLILMSQYMHNNECLI